MRSWRRQCRGVVARRCGRRRGPILKQASRTAPFARRPMKLRLGAIAMRTRPSDYVTAMHLDAQPR
ncbi:hypothetical protein AZ78_1497 [Lysobacter capsici AZ78]|uniref:Uncharacterized protein n=1 Tax=Lysobacter capsici AZ78 TaxID=1444315 RepID=A0A120AG30_9GAMM|nr:hypothetical protein AZ78_1497 [Lysobacter capsici AZ78]